MELFSQLFSEDLIFINFDCEDKYDFFEKISTLLIEKGYVKNSFREAIVKREEKYPTGLRTIPYHVAIPHTDPENIIKPFIAVIRPEHALEFFEMGTDDQTVDARMLFLLGLKKAEGQAPLLSKLIEMFMKQDVMDQLIAETNQHQIINLLKLNVA